MLPFLPAKPGLGEAATHTHPWAESRQAWLPWSLLQKLHHQLLQAHTTSPGVTRGPTATWSHSPSSGAVTHLDQALDQLAVVVWGSIPANREISGSSSTQRTVIAGVQG